MLIFNPKMLQKPDTLDKEVLQIPDESIELDSYPKVSAIIVTKDNTKLLFDAIDSLLEQRYPNLEIIVMDTGSNFDSKEKIKKYLNKYSERGADTPLNYSWGYKYHFSTNNNFAVKELISKDTEYLLFLNNDIKFVNQNIKRFIQFYQQNENVGTLGSQLIFGDQTIQHQGIFIHRDMRGFFTAGHVNYKTFKYKYDVKEVMGNTGAVLMIKKSLFEEIGGFNEKLKLFQDVLLNIECLNREYKNYCINSAICYHYESSTRIKTDYDKQRDAMELRQDLFRIQDFMKNNYDSFKKYVKGFK